MAIMVLLLIFAGLSASAGVPREAPLPGQTRGAPSPYVVVLRSQPLAMNAQTRPATGDTIDTVGQDAAAYTEQLVKGQDAVLAQVAAEPTYRYTTVLNGFAAQLTESEVAAVAARPDVYSVTLDEPQQLLETDLGTVAPPGLPATNVSPELLELTCRTCPWNSIWTFGPGPGSGAVVGVIDTGIDWSNPSFTPASMEPPPADFAGACESGEDAADWPAQACNRKIAGARYFIDGFRASGARPAAAESVSPLDTDSHGTHVAGIVAGQGTSDTTATGEPVGTIGMAYRAHLANYKVCWQAQDAADSGCYLQDALAAVEAAVEDGVDVLNYSIDGYPSSFDDPVNLAFMGASAAGVFVATAAGEGDAVAHAVPWVTTVTAAVHRAQDGPVPSVPDFPAQGPADVPRLQQTILKPDLGAPGVRVLAPIPTGAGGATAGYKTGTSMAAAHVSGIAALLVSAQEISGRPHLPPMAIKSKLMTRVRDYAVPKDNDPHNGGAGFLISHAIDGRATFDSDLEDWEAFLADPSTGYQLNAPSVQVPQLADRPFSVTRTLTLDNDYGPGTFEVSVDAPSTFAVRVEPSRVTIQPGESVDFAITMVNLGAPSSTWQTAWVNFLPPRADGRYSNLRIPVLGRGAAWNPKVDRIGGTNRYDTARLIAERFPEGTDTVYLASGTTFADALAGSPAAARGRAASGSPAPILLVGTTIPPETQAALTSLMPSKIVVLGGMKAVSNDIVRQLRDQGYAVSRIAGADRYETAVKIARLSGPTVPLVYLANGESYPDALAGAAAAARDNAPLLLTTRTDTPEVVQRALDELRVDNVVILGGLKAISNDVYGDLGLARGRRIYGADRWGTAAAVSATFAKDPKRTYIAQGLNWPDALAGSVLAGSQRAPILITEPNSIPPAISTELDRLSPQNVTVLGGRSSVSSTVEDTLNESYGRWIIE